MARSGLAARSFPSWLLIAEVALAQQHPSTRSTTHRSRTNDHTSRREHAASSNPSRSTTVAHTATAVSGVSFTPSSQLTQGVTFTAGLRLPDAVRPPIVIARRTTPPATPTPTPPAAVTETRAVRGENPTRNAPEDPCAHLRNPTPPVVATARTEQPAPPRTVDPPQETNGVCRFEGGFRRVDLRLAPNELATQLSVSVRGDEAVVLVQLARPGVGREGLRYSSGRLVRVSGDGSTAVQTIGGMTWDSSVASGPDGQVLVVSNGAPTTRGTLAEGPAPVRIQVLDAQGRVQGSARELTDTVGARLDAPVVAWGRGYALLLGREQRDAQGSIQGIQERLYRLDSTGALVGTPVEITDEQSPLTLGRWRAGLAVLPHSDELAVAWTVSSGNRQGLWSSRVDRDGARPAERLLRVQGWGAQVASDGSGILFREGGERGVPVQMRFLQWGGRNAFTLGSGWDPLSVFARGRVLTAGSALTDENQHELNTVLMAGRAGDTPRALSVPEGESISAIENAVDTELVATNNGALLAFLEAVDPEQETGVRRLVLARVGCR